jgi:hypothetical protein
MGAEASTVLHGVYLFEGCYILFALTDPERKQVQPQNFNHSQTYYWTILSGKVGMHCWFQIVFILFILLRKRYILFYDGYYGKFL